jgi:hypothetical protein
MQKIILSIGVVIFLLVAGFYAFNSYIYNEKQEPNEVQAYRGTLAGEYICLSFKDDAKEAQDVCQFGIKTEAGEYYAVDFALMSQEKTELNIGDKFSANGLITPIEMLSSDHWQQYQVTGIFSVTDSVKILEQ